MVALIGNHQTRKDKIMNNQLEVIIKDITDSTKPFMDKWEADQVQRIFDLDKFLVNSSYIKADGSNEHHPIITAFRKMQADDNYKVGHHVGLYHVKTRNISEHSQYLDFKAQYLNMKGYSKWEIDFYRCKEDYIRKQVSKLAKSKLSKIGVAVKKKLNFSIYKAKKVFIEHGLDGYIAGAWEVTKNFDYITKCRFSFSTFYAGGHNIQCLHVRTKYKLETI